MYSPHCYAGNEFNSWRRLKPIDKLMFDRKMVRAGTWSAEFRPELTPDENTFVLSTHKALSGFWAGDISIQLRRRSIGTIILAGMSANLCAGSHLRNAEEDGSEVIVVEDATVGPGPEATQAASSATAPNAYSSIKGLTAQVNPFSCCNPQEGGCSLAPPDVS